MEFILLILDIKKIYNFYLNTLKGLKKNMISQLNSMNKQMDLIQQDFFALIEGIRLKYQVSKQQLTHLNSEQINSFVSSTNHFKSFECAIQISKTLFDLHLYLKQQCLFNTLRRIALKIYILRVQDTSQIIYWKEKKFDEAIQIFEQALNLNWKHQSSLWCKADSLRMLGQYNEAIIWVDKALQVDPKHCLSFFTKAESLKMLGQYNEAIVWADKALQVDSKHCLLLYTKGDSLNTI
ncbi:unnamed protein product [Paramecium octaurelia]|uniref:Tetratricopeptide repeat protein n=2 Tax=Paramecium octaurelia TaxID=43137 RepID=A0A8S1XPY2_PAROT|nr:unnamed protein product [Paramecium octaurelia]